MGVQYSRTSEVSPWGGKKSPPCQRWRGRACHDTHPPHWALPGTCLGGHHEGRWVASRCPRAALPRSGARQGALCPPRVSNGSAATAAKAAVVTGGTRGAPRARLRPTLDPCLAVVLMDVGSASAVPHHPAGMRRQHRARRGGGQTAPADVQLGTQMCTSAPRCARPVPWRQAAVEPLPRFGQAAGCSRSRPLARRLCRVPKPGSAGGKVLEKLFGCRK